MTVSEIIKPFLTEFSVIVAGHYVKHPKVFISCFLKFRSYRMACAFSVQQFEKEVVGYEPDEKIENFVTNLPDIERKLLIRTLKMIKLITLN